MDFAKKSQLTHLFKNIPKLLGSISFSGPNCMVASSPEYKSAFTVDASEFNSKPRDNSFTLN